jgi:hypothetical protein
VEFQSGGCSLVNFFHGIESSMCAFLKGGFTSTGNDPVKDLLTLDSYNKNTAG